MVESGSKEEDDKEKTAFCKDLSFGDGSKKESVVDDAMSLGQTKGRYRQ